MVSTASRFDDPLPGQKLSLSAAARQSNLPGRGKAERINESTLWRWIVRGVKAPGGATIKLQAVRVGQRWLTSLEAIDDFIARVTAASSRPTPAVGPVKKTPPRQASRDSRRKQAGQTLDSAGIR